MKKLARTASRLTLDKQTLRSLTAPHAALVVGGRRPLPDTDTCTQVTIGCNPPPVTWTCTDTYHCL
jgi:hypothetical protein